MRIALFSAKRYDREFFELANRELGHSLEFFDIGLSARTVRLAHDAEAICAFVNDDISAATLEAMAEAGIKLLLMRCAGFNNVDVAAAQRLGITIARVPAYSPEAVAEHAVALMLTLNRRIHKAYQRTRDANFSLDGLIGFNMYGKTAGVVGTGRIGLATARILKGFGCQLLAYDPYPNKAAEEIGATYVDLDTLLGQSDIVTLHCPLTPENTYLINSQSLARMKPGAMLINTSRGMLVDSKAAIEALKAGQLSALGLDVYDNEQHLFFEDLSNEVIKDDVFRRLSACHNVIFTGHQAFLTREALTSIAATTLTHASAFARGQRSGNEVDAPLAP